MLKFPIKKSTKIEELIKEIHNGNEEIENNFIKQYKPFIAKTVSSVCKRYIHESDDEFSIGLIAFDEAIKNYSSEKGSSFLSFSELIMKRRTIDYIRKEAKVRNLRLDLPEEDEEGSAQSKLESDATLRDYQQLLEKEQRKEEISYYHHLLKDFGLTLSEIVKHSPKHEDARENAIKVAQLLVQDEQLRKTLFSKRKLPIKELEQKVDVSRKTIERNRKYIIAIAIIITGDFIYLKDYIKGVLQA